MRIYDRDYVKVSDTQMRKMLDEADLEKHGFKLEITSKLTSGSGSDSGQAYQKTYFYYKVVDCSLVSEVDEQLESLIPGKKRVTNPIFSPLNKLNLYSVSPPFQ